MEHGLRAMSHARVGMIEAGPCRDCGQPTVYIAGSGGITVVAGSKLENSPVYLHADHRAHGHAARPRRVRGPVPAAESTASGASGALPAKVVSDPSSPTPPPARFNPQKAHLEKTL